MRIHVLVSAVISVAVCTGSAHAAAIDIPFTSHDGHAMFGKLVLPDTPGPHAVVIHVQTAEGATVDMNRPGRGAPVSYFDLLRRPLLATNVGFFSYEGRGIRNGETPPRYEAIEWPVYNTSTLENKVRDAIAAVQAVRRHPNVDRTRIVLMGTSEGTLLAAEAASRMPADIHGVVLYAVMSANMRDVMRYVFGDGGFLLFRGSLDGDGDGVISKTEYEADPKRFRARVLMNAPFGDFDVNADGVFTAADTKLRLKMFLDAVEASDFDILDRWAKTSAGVTTPENWFRDHFSHAPMWTFLSALTMPVGLFHGDADSNTSIEGVRELEARSRAAGKTNLTFQYFAGADHSVGLGAVLGRQGAPAPPALTAMIDYIAAHVR
jgi:alpha-beta hydrolase superfamily lysophospholipase